MAHRGFNKTVAARTRAADLIRSNPELLERFIAFGGLAHDLDVIVEKGRACEAANVGQGAALSAGMAATGDVVEAFRGLQREYKQVMAVVRAVKNDLEESAAAPALIEEVERILDNETAVHVKTVKGEGDTLIRHALKNDSQEDVRAEIYKDAVALLANDSLIAALAARKVEAGRLTSLRDEAEALSEKLAVRTAKKSERKLATAEESGAAAAQNKRWAAVVRILAATNEDRILALIDDAS